MTSSSRSVDARLNRTSSACRQCLLVCLVAGILLIAVALWFWGAREVRGDVGEVFFLTLIGGVWLACAQVLFPWLGVSVRDDVWERGNGAALVMLGSAVLSVAITYAAGNLGEGPSYSENIFCAALATGGWFVLWLVLELGGRVSRSVAEERDLATGIRCGGLMLAWALILGRAVTGNWHSGAATLRDFVRDGWPAGLLCLLAWLMEWGLRPSPRRPFPSWWECGLVPALCYPALAVFWLWRLGRWEGMPH